MAPFSKTCVALAWNFSAECYGVRVQGTSAHFRVLASWRSGPESGESLSGKLITGAAELKANTADQIVAGGGGSTGGFMDIAVPALRGDEQAQALRYELVRYCPLSLDKILWGYRVIGKTEAGQQHVRLFYLPQEEWENWIEAVRGVVAGVDILISPVAALDPVLSGYDVCFPADGEGWYRDTGNGFRDCAAAPAKEERRFGIPEGALEAEGFDPGSLQQRPMREQASFSSAVVLGMYGVSRTADKDKATWLRLPETLRPRRNRVAQTVLLLLVLYLVGFGGYHGAKYGLAALDHHRQLQERNERLKERIAEARTPEEQLEQLRKVKTQLEEASISRPSLGECLLSLTSRTDNGSWVRRFSWQDGKMSIEVVTEKGDVNLTQKWEESPVLADVVPRRRKIDADNRMTINFRLYADDESGTVQSGNSSSNAADGENTEEEVRQED